MRGARIRDGARAARYVILLLFMLLFFAVATLFRHADALFAAAH